VPRTPTLTLVGLALASALSGCSSALDAAPEAPLEGEGSEACGVLLDDLVEGPVLADVAESDDLTGRTAAFGDGLLAVTCGVAEPAGLEPTSECDDVRGIGWYVDDAELSDPDSAITATAIGVRPRVAVVFSPEARGDVSLATLSALADPVREHLEVVQDCL